MKYYIVLLCFFLSYSFSSCCDGEYFNSSIEPIPRMLKLIDTSNRILKLWYQDVPLIISPNSNSVKLILSTNTKTIFYYETIKNGIDTIEINTKSKVIIEHFECSENYAQKYPPNYSIEKCTCDSIYFTPGNQLDPYQYLYVK